MKTKFRAINNNLILKGLFFETTLADKSGVVYTLKDWDHEGFPSLYRLYLEMNDPTEYQFAVTYLDGLVHWEALCECSWFKEYLARWRRELELRMKSQALKRIMAESKASSREAFNANKYLLEKGWEAKDGSKRGRPSKDDIKAAAHQLAQVGSQINDDYDRITRVN